MRNYGFSQSIQHYEILKQVWEILDDKVEIINKIAIIPDNYKDYLKNIKYNKLNKPFYNYKNNLFYKSYFRSEYNQILENKRIEEEKRLKRVQECEKELKKLKEQYSNEWKTKEWIEENIGEYYTWDPCIEYYWTLIGDQYQIKYNGILIEEEIYNRIKDIKLSLKGSTFLSRKIKIPHFKGCAIKYSGEIIGTYQNKKIPQHYGVYGLVNEDNELIYIGSTMREFETRMKEHRDNINRGSNDIYFYTLDDAKKPLGFIPLIDISTLKVESELRRRDIECMELALIHHYKPIGNIGGNKVPFKFRGK